MLTATVDTIASVTSGQVLVGDASTIANDVSIDSRTAASGCVFFALVGERLDGHDYLEAALASGARVLVVSQSADRLAPYLLEATKRGAAVIHVADTQTALQDLCAWHRARLHCVVVGITGSTGKTTTKDFVTAVLSTGMRVVATEGNRNNELGVPLTLARAGSDTDALVVEMGMRGLGQIARLAEVAKPTMGLVTNVGTSHVELLGSQDNIAQAKAELVRALPDDGAAFVNGDDEYSVAVAEASAAPVTTYGMTETCDVRAIDVAIDDESRASFELRSAQGSAVVHLPVPGRHNVYNALAAAAVGLRLGLTPQAVSQGLSEASLTPMRMESFLTASGVTIINDAYNANPTSMRAAIETLADMRVPGRRIAVLGDMAELGSLAELAHFRIGEAVAQLPIDILITVGERARRIGEGASAEGMSGAVIRPCATSVEAAEVLDDLLERGDAVLVKASRVMELELVVEGIVSPRVG